MGKYSDIFREVLKAYLKGPSAPSAARLAANAGISDSAIVKIKAGGVPTLDTAEALAAAMGAELPDLLKSGLPAGRSPSPTLEEAHRMMGEAIRRERGQK